MSLFSRTKIAVKKEWKESNIRFYVDCHKLKEINQFKIGLVRAIAKDRRIFVVIDTQYSYQNADYNIDDEVKHLTELLDEHTISFRKIMTKVDTDHFVLGFPIKLGNTRKMSQYKIAFLLSSGDFDIIAKIPEVFNSYYYFVPNDMDTEELLDKFFSLHRNMEELETIFEVYIYSDNFIRKLRIASGQENENFIEGLLKSFAENNYPEE
ncbi:MAG: hypothetical protein K0S76_2736 [Herbinix sp.]|jgi:hypothetical protein|nr:hypothetical protein [Herbinix sp.]